MPSGKQETKLDLVIGAVDRFSAPFRRLNEAISRNTQGFRKLGAAVSRLKQETGLNRLTGGVQRLGSSILRLGDGFAATVQRFTRLGGMLSLALGAAGGGITALATDSAAAGREVQRMSARAGVGAESFQRLAYAADSAGVDADGFASVLSDLGEKAVDAATGNEDLQKTFKALGVNVRTANGNMRKSDALLADVADAFARMEDGPAKTAIALQLFSEEGARLIPVLNQGSGGLRELGDEAARLGLVLDQQALKDSEAFAGGLDQLKATLKGLGFTVGQNLIPVLLPLIDRLREWATVNRELNAAKIREWVESFAKRLPELMRAGERGLSGLGDLFEWLGKVSDALGGADNMLGLVALALSGPLLTSLGGAASAFLSLGAAIMATPVGWIMAAVVAIAGAVYLVYENWDEFVSVIRNSPFRLLFEPIIAVVETLKGEWNGFGDFFARLMKNLLGDWSGFVDNLTGLLPDWLKDWMGIGGGQPAVNVPAVNVSSAPDAGGNGGQAMKLSDIGGGAGFFASLAQRFTGAPAGAPVGVPSAAAGSLPGVTNTEVKRTENVVRLIVPEGYEVQGEGDAKKVVFSDDSSLGYMGA